LKNVAIAYLSRRLIPVSVSSRLASTSGCRMKFEIDCRHLENRVPVLYQPDNSIDLSRVQIAPLHFVAIRQ
jgi:hypothetical protein